MAVNVLGQSELTLTAYTSCATSGKVTTRYDSSGFVAGSELGSRQRNEMKIRQGQSRTDRVWGHQRWLLKLKGFILINEPLSQSTNVAINNRCRVACTCLFARQDGGLRSQ